MGLFLKQKQLIPQKIYCSPAKRTRATLKKVLKEIKADEGITEFVEDLYFHGYNAYLEAIRSTSQKLDIVMTLGHNPMTEEAISILSSTPVRQPVKTATIACLTCDTAAWSDIQPGSCEIKWITGPKDLL